MILFYSLFWFFSIWFATAIIIHTCTRMCLYVYICVYIYDDYKLQTYIHHTHDMNKCILYIHNLASVTLDVVGNIPSLRWATLLPKLQSLDQLLSNVTWRERFVAVCLSDKTLEERNRILKWNADHLRGLRWQVISSFCREVSCCAFCVCLCVCDCVCVSVTQWQWARLSYDYELCYVWVVLFSKLANR